MNQPSDSPSRVRRPHGMSKAQVVQYELDRATPDGSCLITKAAKVRGYGYVTIGKRVYRLARLVLAIKFGRELHADEHCCHVCDNRGCINPDHLYVGSPQDNVDDRHAAGRYATAGRAPWKLTDSQVQTIRSRRDGGDLLQDLAAEYGVSISYISMLTNRLRRPSHP